MLTGKQNLIIVSLIGLISTPSVIVDAACRARASKIAVGHYHTIVIDTDGAVWTCGGNPWGQLGIGTSGVNINTLVQVYDGEMNTDSSYMENINDIDGGTAHSLAVDSNGYAWAWGSNGQGQLGIGLEPSQTTPVQVHDGDMNTPSGYLEGVVKISGGNHSLAIDSNNYVWAWGSNQYGELGNGRNGSGEEQRTPVRVLDGEMNTNSGYLENIIDMEAGYYHSIALDSNGHVWTWGPDVQGVLGNDLPLENSNTPVHVHDGDMSTQSGYLENIITIAAAGYTAFAVDANGYVWAWGSNSYGMLGHGSYAESPVPVQVHDGDMNTPSGYLEDIVAVAAYPYHVLALDVNGSIWAWGSNDHGQVGIGSPSSTAILTPVRVKDTNGTGYLTNIVGIAAGWWSSLAIDGYGNVWSWGYNGQGQLGLGDFSSRYTPNMIRDESDSDFNGDEFVNFLDYAMFANVWLNGLGDPDFNDIFDLNEDDVVDMADLGIFTDCWLWQAVWTETAEQKMMSQSTASGAFEDGLYSTTSAELQTQPIESEPLDIEQMLKWLDEIWLDGGTQKLIDEDAWLKFIESLKEEI